MKLLARIRKAASRMAVGHQLAAAFGLLLMLTMLVGGLALFNMARVDAQSKQLAARWLSGVGVLGDARSALVDVRDFEVKLSRTTDASYLSEYEEKMAAGAKATSTALASYRSLAAADGDTAAADRLAQAWAAYQKSGERVAALARAKKQQDAAEISDGAASMAFDETSGALSALVEHDFKGGREAAAASGAVYARSKATLVTLMAAALGLGALLAWAITRGLLRQLGGEPAAATAVARAVAEGDLTTHVPLRAADSSSLMACLASMQAGLASAVAVVREGSENVATASAEIAHGNLDLSNRTEEQASALQQTAAIMGKLGQTVRHNVDSARQADQLARGASSVAVRGGEVVGRVVETMKEINASSRQIADITSVIDGIAFQTNILALNAAVEAARAGEQGRGFAVVAAEVRSLAQRSAGAAKEIKQLIQSSVERVGHGTSLVDEAGKTMTEIVGAIQRVSAIVGEITSASEEQSAGVSEVSDSVTGMESATQQNAALVEQSAAAAASLRQQAAQLVEAVAVFKIPVLLPGDAPQAMSSTASAAPAEHGVERRSPNRAMNVTRPDFRAPARSDLAEAGCATAASAAG